jgi:hypothetical protein
MHPAVSIEDIDDQICTGFYPETQPSCLLIFSSYSEETAGDNYEFLRRLDSYHYHSGQNTACYCVGYSVYDPTTNENFGPGKKVPEEFGVLKFFYPKLFEETRSSVQAVLNQKWRYRGGVDLLLFAVNRSSPKPVAWGRAAVAQSKSLVPHVFGDVEEMFRTILDLNEVAQGKLVPDELNPELAQKKFLYYLKEVGKLATGGVAGGLVKLVIA